jgi:hypothetical protein
MEQSKIPSLEFNQNAQKNPRTYAKFNTYTKVNDGKYLDAAQRMQLRALAMRLHKEGL